MLITISRIYQINPYLCLIKLKQMETPTKQKRQRIIKSNIDKMIVDKRKELFDGLSKFEIALLKIKSDINKLSSDISIRQFVGKEDFQTHIVQDRWMFGLIISMQIGIFVKLFLN